MSKTHIALIALIILTFLPVSAQQQAVGEWAIYPSFYMPDQVEEVGEHVYYTSNGYLYAYNKSSDMMSSITALSGLSDTQIKFIAHNGYNNMLLVAYENGNIDIISNGEIYNIPELKNKVMSASKSINSISFHENLAYIATDFGLIHLDMDRLEVKTTYDLKKKVLASTIHNNAIYIALENEIIYKSLDNTYWFLDESWNTAFSGSVIDLISVGDKIVILGSNNITYSLDNSDVLYDLLPGVSINEIKLGAEGFILVGNSTVYHFDNQLSLKQQVTPIEGREFTHAASYNSDALYWIVNEGGLSALKKVEGDPNIVVEKQNYLYNTHNVDIPYNLAFSNGYLYINNNGLNAFNNNVEEPGYLSYLDPTGKWCNLLPDINIKTIQNKNYLFDNLQDLLPDPNEVGTFYIGSIHEGIAYFKDFTFQRFYNDNFDDVADFNYNLSPLGIMHSMDFDKDKNLWYYYSQNLDPIENCIAIRTPEGKTLLLEYPELNLTGVDYSQLHISPKNELKWLVYTPRYGEGFLFVFDTNNTLDTTTDDKTRQFTTFIDQDGGEVAPSQFYCVAEDQGGAMWVGCSKGIIVLNNTSNVFNTDYRCNRIKIARNDGSNFADILLNDTHVLSILVDPANRKWIGTLGGGLYLVSETGQEVIQHFTQENSYLPSNNILSLAMNPDNGELYVGTDKGLVSYRSDAINSSNDYSNVYAFPNPVEPNYTGVITVTGLQENSLVKICTVTGMPLFQGLSNGGMITWDGYKNDGTRVNAGVYLVYVTNEDGSGGLVTKILVIN